MSAQEITFTGEYPHSLDSQRRFAVPRQWRSEGIKYYVLPGRGSILQLIPEYTFKDFLDKVRKVSLTNAAVGRALALLGSQAQECNCDKQGRISLTPKLKDYAGIDSELIIVGAFTHAQIWNKEAWQQQADDTESVLDVIDSILTENDSDIINLLKNIGGK